MQSVYRIGLDIVAKNSAAPAFRMIMRDLVGMGKHVDLLQGKWGKLRVAAIGAGSAMAGIGILRGMARLVDLSDKLYRNQLRLRQMGMNAGDAFRVDRAALNAQMRYPTVSAAGSAGVSTKLFTTFGSAARVNAALPATDRAEAILENMGVGGASSLGYLIKAIEISGGAFKRVNGQEQFSVSQYKKALDIFLRAQVVTGGLLTPAQIFQATKMAGPAAGLQTIKAYVDTMAEAVQQMGPRGGRGMNMVYKQMMGGMVGRTYLEGMEQLGIVRSGGVKWFQGSSQGSIKPGALLGGDVLNKDGLFAWVSKVLIPDLVKHGKTTLKQQLAAVYQIFGATTSEALIANMIQNKPAYERTAQMIEDAPGASGILKSQLKGEKASLLQLKNAWGSFLEVAGLPLIKPAVRMIHDLTGAIVHLENWAIAHPKLMGDIDKTLVALGVSLVALGSAAVIGALATLAGPTGLLFALGAGITALAAAFNSVPPWLLHFMLGAVAGGAAGSVIPGVGTAAGALIGGATGLIGGSSAPVAYIDHKTGKVAWRTLPNGPTVPGESDAIKRYLASLRAAQQPGAGSLPLPPPWVPAPPAHSGYSDAGGAHPVYVVNGRDIANGVSQHQAKGLQANHTSSTGHNLRRGYLAPATASAGP